MSIQLLESAVDALAAETLDEMDVEVLGDVLVRASRAMNRLESEQTRRLRRFEELGGPAQDGALSTTSWMRWKLRMSGPAAAERMEVAKQIPLLAETDQAFRNGDLTFQHAAVVARAVSDVGIDAVMHAEPDLLRAAAQVDAGRFRNVAEDLRHVLDPKGALDAANALHERRYLRVSQVTHGGFRVDGVLGRDDGALVRRALAALEGPHGKDDGRSAGQRRADALVELASRQLRSGLPSSHGQRPHLVVTVAALTSGGRLGHGEIEGAGPVPAETVARLACDASVTTITVDGDGNPLDLGRRSRAASAALRRALIQRDGGCRFPSCDRPPPWTDAHHMQEWHRGGETRLSNMVLLCRRHHRLMHEGGWSIRL
ncbi:MAG TPA: DUF222 domain-containing protein, partial [Candidatus Dormibacteraeota bacterium]|nr:DUF222 domain-containing protein [Candidatus Dormibacteraeota bacterium]